MSLLGDFKEIKLWKKASPLERVIIIVSTFLATGSIAGLSETFIKWQGFILDALIVYNRLLIPLDSVLDYFVIQYPETMRHMVVLAILAVGGLIRIKDKFYTVMFLFVPMPFAFIAS